jgi:hypothetical protein
MAEVELSFWAKVALGGLMWTAVSTAVALFLGRLLRDASHDTEHAVSEGSESWLEHSGEMSPLAAASVHPRAETSALDELPPAELADDEGEDDSTRSSGTRYRPVLPTEAAPQRRLRSVG